MCGISLKDRRSNEELRRLVGVISLSQLSLEVVELRWYGHVMRKGILLLVVSLHQSDPLSDTFFCDIVVNHEIIERACLSQQRALEEMLHCLWHV